MKSLVKAVAPIRICDIGGWTDTWFAGQGAVFNISVYPYVEVQVRTREAQGGGRVRIAVENFDDEYSIDPARIRYDKHPLLEAAVDIMELPQGWDFDINIYSDAPPGASTGTSAAVSVALIGALDSLTPGHLTAHEVALLAQRIETEKLGLQCGIQDQLASAYGGINFIEMFSYPHASVSTVQIPNRVWWELEHRLALIYIGAPHQSSEIHQKVIDRLGADAASSPELLRLRELASAAKNAILAGSFEDLGDVMNENTQVQRQLHPDLVCSSFEEIIEVAGEFGVLGCKVNGAGGDGGSLTILTDGNMSQKRKLLAELDRRSYRSLPIYLARMGLRVW
ncbi:MAG: GHMP kinase [Acidobacteriota bacterium]|nr:MAG: GHMP kinase [Acidobacteriota bacterium]